MKKTVLQKEARVSNVAVREKAEIARPLPVLVPLIKRELEDGYNAGMEHYRRAGEMLLEAKGQVPHGEWRAWVDRNFELSYRTARVYMELATKAESGRPLPFSSLMEMSSPNRTTHCPPWTSAVREEIYRVDMSQLRLQSQNREHERKLLVELGYRVIEIGYKALAVKLHSDKGGSDEAMARLNQVRTILRRAL